MASATSNDFQQRLRETIQSVLAHRRGVAPLFAESSCCLEFGHSGRWTALKQYAAEFQRGGLSSRSDAPFLLCEPYVKCSTPEWLAALWRWRRWARHDDFSYPLRVTVEFDRQWRSERSEAVGVTSFQELTYALLPLFLPCAYLEGLGNLRDGLHRLGLARPKVAYTANALHGNLPFKLMAADWCEEGTRIFDHQHGGGYGLSLREPVEEYELRVSDRFYSYGWGGTHDKIRSLSIPVGQHCLAKSARHGVLLTLAGVPPFVYRINFNLMPGTTERKVRETVEFVRNTKSIDLTVRPHSQDFGLNLVSMLQKERPGIGLDRWGKGGMPSFAHRSLIVHNYLGTAWLETLAMNIPTICIYDTSLYAYRADALPFVDRLVDCGILHATGRSAAAFVEALGVDVQAWWNRPEVQDARRAFVARYANFSVAWKDQWEAEFRPIVDSSGSLRE
jgi:putative transferase (TIGR04331 family)